MAIANLDVQPIEANFSLKDRIYGSLKQAITSMNIYAEDAELRLDERELSDKLAISRTPIREALARLERLGFGVGFSRLSCNRRGRVRVLVLRRH